MRTEKHSGFAKRLTLSADENNGDLGGVPEEIHFAVVVVDGVEAALVLQAEHEYDGVHPG